MGVKPPAGRLLARFRQLFHLGSGPQPDVSPPAHEEAILHDTPAFPVKKGASGASAVIERASSRNYPDEVIGLICRHARRPPPARAAWNDCASSETRQPWRQPTLAALMRVSKQFYLVAGEHLYTRIITDNLPGLVLGALGTGGEGGAVRARIRVGTTGTPIAGTKLQLLSFCRHFSLEPPLDLLIGPIGTTKRGNPREETRQVRRCIVTLTDVMRRMSDMGGFGHFFPHLERLSTSAYTGHGYRDMWVQSRYTADLLYAWDQLAESLDVRYQCGTVGRMFPLQGSAGIVHGPTSKRVQARMTDHKNRSRRVMTAKQEDRVFYLHNDDTNQPFAPPLNVTVRNPYACINDDHCEALKTLIVQRVKSMLEGLAEAHRYGDEGQRLNAEICIPLADADLCHARWATTPAARVARVNAVVRETMEVIMREYTHPGLGTYRNARVSDRWTIRVCDKPTLCPACEPDADPRFAQGQPAKVISEWAAEWVAESETVRWLTKSQRKEGMDDEDEKG